MFLLRCTRKLLRRAGAVPQPEVVSSTTRLGDWTANVLITRRQHVVLAVSSVSLLPVVLPVAPAKTIPVRLPEAIADVLRALGVSERKVASELRAMDPCRVTVTNDRRVLGSMNDFGRMMDAYLDDRSLVDVAVSLAEAPCSPIGMASPRSATLACFSSADPPRAVGPSVSSDAS